MLLFALFFIIGELMADYDLRMTIGWMAGILMPAVFITIRLPVRYRKWRKTGMWLCLLPAAAIAGGCLYTAAELKAPVYEILKTRNSEAVQAVISGTVERIEEKNSICVFIKECQAQIHTEEGITETYYLGGAAAYIDDGLPFLGSRILLEGRLCLFEQASNPGQFDPRSYYHSMGYDYRLYAERWSTVSSRYDPLKHTLYLLKRRIDQILKELCGQPDYGIYNAVLLGERSHLSGESKKLFQDQGIAHILSVSGMHISTVGLLFFAGSRWLTGSFGISGMIGGTAVFLYGTMTGNPVSAMRAVIMYLVLILGSWKGRIYDMPSAAALAALVILTGNPLYIHLPAMQLSFCAVLGLSLTADAFSRLLYRPSPGCSKILHVLGLQASMLPVVLWLYHQFPAYGLIINPLVLPFAAVLIAAPAAAAAVFFVQKFFAKLILQAGNLVIRYYELLCRFFQSLPGTVRHNGQPSVWRIAVYVSGLLIIAAISRYEDSLRRRGRLAAAIRKQKRKQAAVVFLAALYYCFGAFFLHAEKPNALTITMLDVGQGDCVLIETPEHINILSDAGSSTQKSLCEYLLEPVLFHRGIDRLDYIVASHGDADHINGIIELMDKSEIEIGSVLIPKIREEEGLFEALIAAAQMRGIQVIELLRGDSFSIGSCSFQVLSPEAGMENEDSNACSLVYTLKCFDFSMLFTGDLPSVWEKQLVGCDPVTILKVSHHGSKYATSQELLAALKPKAALISCSAGNSYGHPHTEVLERLKRSGTRIYRTDECGAITIRVRSGKMVIDTFL